MCFNAPDPHPPTFATMSMPIELRLSQ
ncbi:hypothetical protein F383_03772 [Gossypium arboreum]|uniref:Uncharacterized protein n=1 Tax=Gossypium arboreum TaxID=29729 RepID=A0A0B0NWD7_GOSAR|nr:hypothetical protein F383_03772 [Gossypium arboreum]